MKKLSLLTASAIIISTLISGCAEAPAESLSAEESTSSVVSESTPETTTSASESITEVPKTTVSETPETTTTMTSTTVPEETPAPETTTTTVLETSTPAPETTTIAPETTTFLPETTTKVPETAPSNGAKPDADAKYFTTLTEGNTSMGCFTFEGQKGAWAHLLNPYNAVSLYSPISPGKMNADTENIIICFNVSGLTEEITAFCGLLAYGCGEDDEELSVWNNDTYKSLTGEDFNFTIAMNGYYEMVVPISKLADGLDYWEGLSYTSIVEIAFYGAEKTDEEGKYTGEIKDGLSFEFLGIKAE